MEGTVYQNIKSVLANYPEYEYFRNGKLGMREYLLFLDNNVEQLESAGLNEDQMHLSSRFSINEDAKIDSILLDLKAQGIIETINYPKLEFESFREKVYSEYIHESQSTYIFPEEERLIYALSQILEPKSTILLGSYYGYWGIWAMPAIQRVQGKAYYIDIDKKVSDLALANHLKLGFSQEAEMIVDDAIQFSKNSSQTYDFVLLDAELPADHPNEDLRGKAIYFALAQAIAPKLQTNAVMIAHNILLSNVTEDPYYSKKISKNLKELGKFLSFANRNFDFAKDYNTSEGVGLYHGYRNS